jgi:hypothetical protein
MWLEAIVSQDDFSAFGAEVLPLTIHLGEPSSGHYLSLSAPAEVSLVENRGLRITCNADIHWPVLGMEIPVHVQGLTVLLEPKVSSAASSTTPGGDDALSLGMQIEHADVAWVPAALDAKIVEAINAALEKKSAELSWHFAKTLGHLFELPALVQPLYGVDLKVAWGKVRTTTEAMVLVVSFHAHALRQDEMARERALATAKEDRERLATRALASRPPSNGGGPSVAVAVGAGLALLTSWLTIRGVYRLFSRSDPRRSRAYG